MTAPGDAVYGLLHDSFYDHPKVVELLEYDDGLAAIGLWSLALIWARKQADPARPERAGIVPAAMVTRLAGDRERGRQLAVLLASARAGHQHGLWVELSGGGYLIHEFAPHQELAKWASKSTAARRAAAARWHQDGPGLFDAPADANADANADASAYANGDASGHANAGAGAMPISSHLTSVQRSSSTSSKPSSKPDPADLARFGEFYDPYPRHEARGAAERAWAKALARAPAQTIIDGAKRYAELCEREARARKYRKLPATWLNADCWADETEPDQHGPPPTADAWTEP